jgi:hypothetical protein
LKFFDLGSFFSDLLILGCEEPLFNSNALSELAEVLSLSLQLPPASKIQTEGNQRDDGADNERDYPPAGLVEAYGSVYCLKRDSKEFEQISHGCHLTVSILQAISRQNTT